MTAPGRPAILNTEPGRLSTRASAALHALGQVTDVEADRAYLTANIGRFDALFVCLRNVIDGDLLAQAPRLRCIATPTTGTDHLDVPTARARGIEILSLAGERAFLDTIAATAEHTWGLLLALIRHIPAAHTSVLAGAWARDAFRGTELHGKTLGIVGFGRLGRMVARYGLAFRMRVLAFDRSPEPMPGVACVPLHALLGASDVVSLHLPLTADTAGLFAAEAFGAMKPGAILLNTARGRIVDEPALLDALQSGRLAGAAVDVLAGETSGDAEWLRDHALRHYAAAHSNLLLTPHIGGMTAEAVDETNLFTIRKLAAFLAGAKAGR